MNELRRCPQCDAEIPNNSPIGLCPRCLLKVGADSQSAAIEPGPTKLTPPSTGFVPPTVEELAPLFPQLEILELLGKGGMGAVYKARQPGLDRLVAVKILPTEISHDPAFAERFQREARALARLSHPHIVAVYDFGETMSLIAPRSEALVRGANHDDSLCYIIMEFVDGANLRQAMRTGTLTSAEALAIVPQICEALQFAHDEGIVHRDIKPENILIDKRGRVKIADFGLAKLLGQDANDHSLTATHQVMGTLRYMAPEQMQGSRAVDHRADIYSLGVVFYELLTGELPMGRFAPPSKRVQVDVRLDEVVLRALEQDPEQRYQHASEVKTDVDAISRDSQPPNLNAQKLAHQDGRTTRAEPVSLPFEIAESVHWGLFGEVHGKLRLGKNELVVEFEVRSLFPAFRSGLKEVSIPFDDIESVNWDGWDLTLHTKTMKALAEIPKSSQGQVAFDLSFTDLDVPGGISEPVEHFLACLPSRLVGQSASVARPESAKGVATEPHLVQAPADCMLLAAGIAFVTACGVAVWLGVTASRENNFSTSMVRGNLIGMSVALATYSLFVGGASLMLRLLQARFFVLLVAVIVGLFFPAVCALNVVMELRNIPVWPVVIPLWLGMPAALWVVVRLFRDDVRGTFDAAEQRRLRDFSNPPQQTPSIPSEPRFSRFAIAGAVWALFGLLAIIPTLYFIGLNRVWNGTALPTDVIHSEPPLAFTIFMGALLAIGSGAPIGTTVYGGIAIGHIKRSGGKIIGLPLAVADVLFFPLLVLSGLIAALVAQVVFAIAPHPNAAAVTSAGAFGVLVALVVCFFVSRAVWRAIHPTGAMVVRERSVGAWSVLEIVTAVAVVTTFVLAAVKGIYELAQWPCPMDVVAAPIAALASLAAGALLIVHQIHRPSGARAALPELFITVLAACAGSLPWTAVFSPIAGWNFWQGAVFASLNFVLSLFLLIVGNSRPRTRALITLLVGLIGFALVMWFNVGPVGVIGGSEFLTTITRKPGLPGMFIAAALGLLAMIAGALQLRARSSDEKTDTQPAAVRQVEQTSNATPTEAVVAQESLPYLLGWLVHWLLQERWFVAVLQTATALIYAACLIAFFSFQSTNTQSPNGLLTRFQVGQPSAWLTLEASKSGQHASFEFLTLTHFVALFGLVSLAVYRWQERRSSGKAHSMISHYFVWGLFMAGAVGFGLFTQADAVRQRIIHTTTAGQVEMPSLNTITNGIGAEFTIPARHVATFEIVTRRDNETVPVPSHCAYLMAAYDKPITGQFRWTRIFEEAIQNKRSPKWRMEILVPEGSLGFSEPSLDPVELNEVVGRRQLPMGLLVPNEEVVDWGTADIHNLPDNGLIGLRVTVLPHGLKLSHGSGIGNIDWKKAQTTQSTSRRKLDKVTP